ncbi:MAG: L-aspartate oxidase [Candidatus Eisenbacteria bacterium]|uniref:L-aspartate oxidase n=1 Tax=Eiseniibacteriota bacterium TaxID=2212470 RepID=A0A538T9Q8_UNCEI|nr:MAG: L-aspartate oxidase [Candidatus Eisenbacteria bacterium]
MKRSSNELESDVLVVGSGIAGLSVALHAARFARVLIVTKREGHESNTNYAQGGIAAVLGEDDRLDLHERDTLVCGAGLCDPESVRVLVEEGSGEIAHLVSLGVRFDRDPKAPGTLALGREGGHSRRRIVHAKDRTGRAIETTLLRLAERHPKISILENQIMVDLILESKHLAGRKIPAARDRVWGAYVLHRATGKIRACAARATVLATGGAGKAYLYTTNPDIATGDGLAAAFRAGAPVANLEFIQFHPTCLFHPEAKSFLISEAVRGEGARLLTTDGKPFMHRYHRLRDLAPRDIVARAIDAEMKRRGDKFVLLDMARLGKRLLEKRFPHITSRVRGFGYDLFHEPIPVVPAAHYICGGVVTDLDGRTAIPALYACGEVACTGVHGANRLASNSLLEALVFARRAGRAVLAQLLDEKRAGLPRLPAWRMNGAIAPKEQVIFDHNWDALRRVLWDYMGIVRSDERLRRAAAMVDVLRDQIERDYWRYRLDSDLVELRNIGLVADLMVACALRRKESRGLHYNVDHHRPLDRFRSDTMLTRRDVR